MRISACIGTLRIGTTRCPAYNPGNGRMVYPSVQHRAQRLNSEHDDALALTSTGLVRQTAYMRAAESRAEAVCTHALF